MNHGQSKSVCLIAWLALALTWGWQSAAAEDAGLIILHHEPFAPFAPLAESSEEQVPASGSAAPSERWVFEAFGTRFDLMVENNERVVSALPAEQRAELADVRLLRGRVVGVPNSWLRLTQRGESWSGMIWDGVELYAIDARDELESALQEAPTQRRGPAEKAPETLVYRMSDTRVVAPIQCGLEDGSGAQSQAEQYGALRRQLSAALEGVPESSLALEIAIVADEQFVATNGSNSMAAVVNRINIVDGIFDSQVGVGLSLVDVALLQSNGSLTSTDAGTLLNQFSRLSSIGATLNPGLAHLFTGRAIDGGTVGIAFIGGLCSAPAGVGVSETRGTGISGALTVAHEIGHNFGAPHDNQEGSPCASTPNGFLMNPFLNGSDTFSQCSLDRMGAEITRASCLVAVEEPIDPGPSRVIFSADFDADPDDFRFEDDAFRGTAAPRYARGLRLPEGGFTGAGLSVFLGGIDGADIFGISGAWTRAFELESASEVSLGLRINLAQARNYEADEFSDALVSIDGVLVAQSGDRLARIVGNGNGGTTLTSGWLLLEIDLGTLGAGSHEIAIGGFNNKKTFRNELTRILIDDVEVTAR